MAKHYVFLLLIPALFWQSACKKIPNNGIPFYLQTDSVVLNIDNAVKQGPPTQKITDLWVETDAHNLGAWELPCSIPVLEENNVNFIIQAGIYQSGQSGTRVPYPMYAPDTVSITATPGQKYYHVPHFKYKAGCVIPFNADDFENGSTFDVNMLKIQDPTIVKYGNYCGKLTVNATDSNVQSLQKVTPYTLTSGDDIWVELDYKSDVPVYVGFYGYNNLGGTAYPVLLLVPNTNWTKVYVRFTDFIEQVTAGAYRIYFEALRPYGSSGGSAYIDNVKIVYLPG